MVITVDKKRCEGCGTCSDLCPDVFVQKDELAEVKPGKVPSTARERCAQAGERCPNQAILIVFSPSD